jgi:hypothetical protein
MPTEYCHSAKGDGVWASAESGETAIPPMVAAIREVAAMLVCLLRTLTIRFLRLFNTEPPFSRIAKGFMFSPEIQMD